MVSAENPLFSFTERMRLPMMKMRDITLTAQNTISVLSFIYYPNVLNEFLEYSTIKSILLLGNCIINKGFFCWE